MALQRAGSSLPRRFQCLVAAQFFSALADHALILVVLALVLANHMPDWWAPVLKMSFTLAYVVLAPGVGTLADRWPKTRVMMAMNAIKVLGVLLLLAGLHPALALAVVGVGATAYAPAKYGIVTEWVRPAQLVRANAWLEVGTVNAVLLGTALGGLMVGPWWTDAVRLGGVPMPEQDLAPVVLLGLYGVSAAFNLGVPDTGARYGAATLRPRAQLRSFVLAHRRLWADEEASVSMIVTTLFWGAAAVLQLAILQWATTVLNLGLDQATYLQVVVAVGIVGGAAVAGRAVPLAAARRLLPVGVLMGALISLAALCTSWHAAVPLLLIVGALGGAMVLPLNALLQHRGHVLITAGRSVAVQNFNENLSVLLSLAIYAVLLAMAIDVRVLLVGLGLWVAVVMARVQVGQLRRHREGRRQRSGALSSTAPPAANRER